MKSFLKNAYFVPLFFIFLCVFSLVMAMVLSGYKLQTAKALSDIARFEVFDFKYFKITRDGVYMQADGKKARENSKKENEIEHLNVRNYTQSQNKKSLIEEHLQADFALYDNQNIFFPQGVNYQRDRTHFWSEEAFYNPNLKTLEGQGEFLIVDKNYKVRGNNIVYKNGKVYANDIRGTLKAKK